MNCHRCQTSIKYWRTHCPQCGAQLLPLPYSTISDSATSARGRRAPLVKAFRLSLLVVALVGLAVTAKLNSARSSGQPPQPSADSTRRASAAPSPTPAPASPAAEESGPPPPAVAEAPAPTAPAPAARAAVPPPTEFSAEPAAKAAAMNAVATNAALSAPTAPPAPASAAPARPAETAAPKVESPQRADIAMPKVPSVTQSVEARAGLEVEGGAVLLSRHTALLTIKSYVPARVYIDGAYSGVTPRSVKLVAGEHTVTLVADGFQEWTRKVRLNGQEQAGILASLKKPGAAGGQ
jgi:hypothetical protein